MALLDTGRHANTLIRSSRGLQPLFWKPRSLTSFTVVSNLIAVGGKFDLVIDGGANVGQFARACVECML